MKDIGEMHRLLNLSFSDTLGLEEGLNPLRPSLQFLRRVEALLPVGAFDSKFWPACPWRQLVNDGEQFLSISYCVGFDSLVPQGRHEADLVGSNRTSLAFSNNTFCPVQLEDCKA